MRDDFDEIIDKLKKFLKLDSDIFDIDVLFLPEKNIDLGIKPDDKNMQGFKISYHFETGMDKPEIKIEGDIDNQEIKEFLKNVNINKYPNFKKLFDSNSNNEIDASELTLDTLKQDEEMYILEPYTEVNEDDKNLEIIIEVPGIDSENVKIDFSADGKTLLLKAQNRNRNYFKKIFLPSKALTENYQLDVHNGIAHIILKKLGK